MGTRVIVVPAKTSEVRVEAKADEIVILELEQPSAAGYRYKMTLSSGLEVPLDETRPGGERDQIGASSIRRIHLRAPKAGRYTMALHLVRPWLPDEVVRSHLILLEAH